MASPRMLPEKLSHYRVKRLLGAGGMGEVYLAEDATLNRNVALKLLPARYTQDEERVRRFKREARAASALNHPNIITIYEIGEADSVHFIATEFIEGETLRQRMTTRNISLADVIDVGIGVGSALAAAHDAGIIHRDIKPENIMLRPDGYVKVLDFGLAKLLDEPSATDSTTGQVMGTLLYISPEQARGHQPDARSDVYALGAVMYEMVTRKQPITGDNFVDLAMAIATKTPQRPSAIVAGIPPTLERIIMKALEKDPGARYPSARQMVADLRTLRQELELENALHARDALRGVPTPDFALQPTAPLSFPPTTSSRVLRIRDVMLSTRTLFLGTLLLALIVAAMLIAKRYQVFGKDRIESVAVLAFANVTHNPDSEYLSDGLSESIIDSLSQLPDLQVIAKSTAFRFKGKNSDPLSVGRELHVRGVVSGELAQRGDSLVIHAVLTDVKKGTQIWGQQYERKLSEVLSLQRDLSAEISRQLLAHLTGREKEILTRRGAENSEAFQLYLKGRYFATKYNDAEQARRGIAYYNQAIDADPTYAQAWAGIAEAYYGLSNLHMPPRDAMPKARQAAERALSLDERNAEAHTARAEVLIWYDWDFTRGERELQRALALNKNDADAHRVYGDYLTARGQFDRAIAEKRKAEALDPLSIIASWDVGRSLFFAGRYDEAREQVKRTLELDDRFPYAYYLESEIDFAQGNSVRALQSMQRAMELGGHAQILIAQWGYEQARLGNRDEARKAIQELEARASNAYTVPLLLARIHAGLGDNDQAMALLQKVYDDRSESVVWLKVDPTFNPLRNDPRFQALLAKVGA